MLKRLLIENYALIDHLDISFPGELVIITGETGAGKSILLGALSLVLGGRSDVSVLKDPKRNCVVEAVFEQEGVDDSFGLAAHAGLDFKVSEKASVRVDVRWADIDTDVKVDGAKLGTANIDPLVYGASYVMKF